MSRKDRCCLIPKPVGGNPIAAPRIRGYTSQRMKPVSFLLALMLASSLLAARPVAEIERITKDNAYQGVWLEIHQRLLHNL